MTFLRSFLLRRAYSTAAPHPVLSRKYPAIYDHLAPSNSHLLRIALAPHLKTPIPEYPIDISAANASPLPPGHHLVYFPPHIPETDLMADGSDATQSPGPEYIRRMWAGGSLAFNYSPEAGNGLKLGVTSVCKEQIRDVKSKGEGEKEMLFVGFERAYYASKEGSTETVEQPGVLERRDLVYFKSVVKSGPPKIVPAPRPPTFFKSLTPTTHLLFRFSALSYNAHKIHFDPIYTANEGHGAPLVHGPLMLVLMLEVVNQRLAERGDGKRIKGIEYRNLRPVPVGKETKVCGREKEDGNIEVWVEIEGGLAVRGTVTLE